MDQFFIDDGSQYLVFFYQEPEPENYQNGGESSTNEFFCGKFDLLAESYRPGLSPYANRSNVSSQKQTKPKVIIADPQEQSLHGICLCFLRNSKKTVITGQNIINVSLIHSLSLSFPLLSLFLLGSFFLHIRM